MVRVNDFNGNNTDQVVGLINYTLIIHNTVNGNIP